MATTRIDKLPAPHLRILATIAEAMRMRFYPEGMKYQPPGWTIGIQDLLNVHMLRHAGAMQEHPQVINDCVSALQQKTAQVAMFVATDAAAAGWDEAFVETHELVHVFCLQRRLDGRSVDGVLAATGGSALAAGHAEWFGEAEEMNHILIGEEFLADLIAGQELIRNGTKATKAFKCAGRCHSHLLRAHMAGMYGREILPLAPNVTTLIGIERRS
jgi:hypothetical protein